MANTVTGAPGRGGRRLILEHFKSGSYLATLRIFGTWIQFECLFVKVRPSVQLIQTYPYTSETIGIYI